MEWLRSHPYLDATVMAAALLITGFLIVRTQLAAPLHIQSSSWGTGGSVLVDTVSGGHGTYLPQMGSTVSPNAVDVGYIPLKTENEIGTGPVDEGSAFDFAAFAEMLSQPSTGSAPTAQVDTEFYSFIPTGLMATTTLTKPRTSQQDNLYYYGNDVGDAIISFENQHPDQPAVLKNHFEQPENPSTIAAMKTLGEDMASLGDTLGSMQLVPTEVKAAHLALADAYRDIGTKLAAVPDAKGNDALYTAMETYNSAAEQFVKRFVALALIFQAYDVTFSLGDGGSVFVFTGGGL